MMNSLDISNIQQRKPRRSMLGTHRSNGFRLNEKPSVQINKKVSKTNSTSASITNIPRRPSRKNVLGIDGKRRNNICSTLPADKSVNSSIRVSVDADKIVGAYDSFEKNETFMMAEIDEDEESGHAHSLFDNTVVEMTGVIPHLENDDAILSKNATNTIPDVTVTTPKAQDSTLSDLLSLLNLIIENNSRTVNRYHKQIDEMKTEIEEKKRQTQDITTLKCRLMKKFHLNEGPNEMLLTKSTEQTESKPLECLGIDPDQKDNIVSSNYVAVPSKQIIHELRSTIKFLKTPRSSKRARKSIMLTPHSMIFSIESQLEKLLE